VAFGAESPQAPWGPVFDVLLAVDRAKSAGDARYVLGYPAALPPARTPPALTAPPSAEAPAPPSPAPPSL
jgi:hypothetical protein